VLVQGRSGHCEEKKYIITFQRIELGLLWLSEGYLVGIITVLSRIISKCCKVLISNLSYNSIGTFHSWRYISMARPC
jgi:hypothetical protein